jgi:hypothetical protein
LLSFDGHFGGKTGEEEKNGRFVIAMFTSQLFESLDCASVHSQFFSFFLCCQKLFRYLEAI